MPYVYTASVLHNDNQPRASFVDTRTPASKDYQIGGHNRKSTRAKKRMSEAVPWAPSPSRSSNLQFAISWPLLLDRENTAVSARLEVTSSLPAVGAIL